MTPRRVLGPLVSPWSFERAARDLLIGPLVGLYADEINRQHAALTGDTGPVIRIERPRSVKVRWRASRFSEDMLPSIVIVNAGTVGEPQRDGEGLYHATWQMTVAAVSQATGEDAAREVASDLCTAAAAVLLHMLPKVDDRVTGVRWIGAVSTDVDVDGDDRSRCVFANGLQIGVQDCFSDLAGLPADWDVPDPPIPGVALNVGELETVLSADVVSATPVDVDEPV